MPVLVHCLRAFAAGYERATADTASARLPEPPKPASAGKQYPLLAPIGDAGFDALVADASANFPAPLHGMIAAGLRKVVETFVEISEQGGGKDSFVDTLTFTTTIGASVTPSIKINPVLLLTPCSVKPTVFNIPIQTS